MESQAEVLTFGSKVSFFYPPHVLVSLLALLWLAVVFLGVDLVASALLWVCATAGKWPGAGRGGGAVCPSVLPSLDLFTQQQLTGPVLLHLVGAHGLAGDGNYRLARLLRALATITSQLEALPAAGLKRPAIGAT